MHGVMTFLEHQFFTSFCSSSRLRFAALSRHRWDPSSSSFLYASSVQTVLSAHHQSCLSQQNSTSCVPTSRFSLHLPGSRPRHNYPRHPLPYPHLCKAPTQDFPSSVPHIAHTLACSDRSSVSCALDTRSAIDCERSRGRRAGS